MTFHIVKTCLTCLIKVDARGDYVGDGNKDNNNDVDEQVGDDVSDDVEEYTGRCLVSVIMFCYSYEDRRWLLFTHHLEDFRSPRVSSSYHRDDDNYIVPASKWPYTAPSL